MIKNGQATTLATNVPTPPVNIGPRSTPNYSQYTAASIKSLPGGGKVFAGQRNDPFFVDLGSVFDLLGLRPINSAHLAPLPNTNGRRQPRQPRTCTPSRCSSRSAQLTKNGNVPTTVNDQGVGHRRLRLEQPPAGQDPVDHRWRTELLRRVGPGQPARHPARQRGADPAGQEGQVERGRPRGRRAVLRQHPRPRAHQAPARSCTRRCSTRTTSRRVAPRTGPTWSSSSPVSSPGSPPPTRCRRPTSSGSTWRSRRCRGTPSNRLAALQGDAGGFPNGRRLTDDVVDIELRVLAGELLDSDGKINGTGGVPFSVLKDGVNNAGRAITRPVPLPRRSVGGLLPAARSADDLTCAGAPSARWS